MIVIAALEAPAVIAGFDNVAVVGHLSRFDRRARRALDLCWWHGARREAVLQGLGVAGDVPWENISASS